MAALLAVVAPSASPAGAAGPATCSYTDTGTAYDVTWDLEPSATKHIVYRTVNGSSSYWRGAIDAPGTSFTGDAYPSGGGTVVYSVTAKDGNTDLGSTTCTEILPEAFACTVADNGTDYDIAWNTSVGADKYVIQRQVDGTGTWYWRGAVNAPGSSFDSDAEPTQTYSTVDYQVVAKDGNTVLDTIDCYQLPAYCSFMVLPSGDVGLTLDPDQTASTNNTHTVHRSANGGAATQVVTLEAETFEYLDEDPPVGTLAYSVKELANNVVVVDYPCEEAVYDFGVTAADAGIPTLPNGQPGGTGSSLAATKVVLTRPTPSTATQPQDANTPVCSASLYKDVPPAGYVWSRIFIPSGATLRLDLLNRKNDSWNGSWGIEIDAYEINPDGTAGAQKSGGLHESTSYYWSGTSQDKHDRSVYTNTGTGRSFLLRMKIYALSSMDSYEGAYSEATNFRLETNEGTSYPCSPEEAEQCGSDGGNMYFASPIVHNGETLSGCYYKDSCFANLPGFLGSIQSFTCENTAEINTAIVAGALIAIAIPGLAIVAEPYAMGLLLTGATELGAAQVLTSGGIGFAGAIAGFLVYDISTENNTGKIIAPAIDVGAYTLDQVEQALEAIGGLVQESPAFAPTASGSIEQTSGQTLVDVLLPSTTFLTKGDLTTEAESTVQLNVKNALSWCVATLTVSEAVDFLPEVSWTQPITTTADFFVSGPTPAHICTGIPMIVQAGRAMTSGTPIAQATMHQNEALFGTPPYSPVAPLHETQPNVLAQTPPHKAWIFLSREISTHTSWYTRADYKCKGNRDDETACDEYPWNATHQGGGAAVPTPHLRIIDSSQNSASGSELGTFYGWCEVGDDEHFLSIPAPNQLLVSNWWPSLGAIFEPVPSTFVGPTCQIP